MTERTWDAATYHRVSGPMEAMGVEVLERLPLRGDETVLDAGCGTGRVTAHLCRRLRNGRVVAVDLSEDMVERARAFLGPRADVRRGDLVTLSLEEPVDAVFSTATFHWIDDHDALFANLFDLLRPGGLLVAQCGGEGNLTAVLAAAEEVAREPEFAEAFQGWARRSNFASAEPTRHRLEAAGFTDVRCRLSRRPAVPDDTEAYLETIVLGPHVQRLEQELRRPFVERVAARLATPATIDYVRLDIDARRPG